MTSKDLFGEILNYDEDVYQQGDSSEDDYQQNDCDENSNSSNNVDSVNLSQVDQNNQSNHDSQIQKPLTNLNQSPSAVQLKDPQKLEEIIEKNKITFCLQENCNSYKQGLLPDKYKEHHEAHVSNLETPLFLQMEETTLRELVRKSLSRNISSDEAIEQFALTNTLKQSRNICNFLNEYKELLTVEKQIEESKNKVQKDCENELLLPNKKEESQQGQQQQQQLLILSQVQLGQTGQNQAINGQQNGNANYQQINEDIEEQKESIQGQQQQYQSQLQPLNPNEHLDLDDRQLITQQLGTEGELNLEVKEDNAANPPAGILDIQNVQTEQKNDGPILLEDNNNTKKNSSHSANQEKIDPRMEFTKKYFASSEKCEFDDIKADFISVFSFIKRAKKAYSNKKNSTGSSRTSSQILANCYSEIWKSKNGIKTNNGSNSSDLDDKIARKREFKKLMFQKIQETILIVMYLTLCVFEFVQICQWSEYEENYPSNSALRVLVLILFSATAVLTCGIWIERVIVVRKIPLLFQTLHFFLSLLVLAYFISTLIVGQPYSKWCYLSFMIVISSIATVMVFVELVLNKNNWNQAKMNFGKLKKITDCCVMQEFFEKEL